MISETPTTATPCDMEIAPETNTGDEAVSSFDATNGNESGSSFDATTFTSMILESQDFVDTVKRRMEEGVKVALFVPVKDSNWSLSEKTGSLSDSLLFTCAKDEIEWRSINNNYQLAIEENHAVLKDNDIKSDERRMVIKSQFSIDSEGILMDIFILDATFLDLGIPATRSASTFSFKVSPSADSLLVSSTTDNTWREILLKKLREPETLPIVKEIKRIIKYLSQDGVSTFTKSQITQKFYKDLKQLLGENAKWKNATVEEIEGSIDAIERYVFSKCSVFVYQAVDTNDLVQDKLFLEKTKGLAQLSISEIDGELTEENSKRGREILVKLGEFDTPDEKLTCLIALMKMCANHDNESASRSADTLLPVLMKIIMDNHPCNLISDIRYIQRFHNHARMGGETAYCMTNIVAVITMIEKLHGEKISKTNPIYSMLAASQEDLQKMDALAIPPSAKSTSSEINSMTSTLLNTIGFVPRAIGSAVADTFRSRAAASKKDEISPGLSKTSMAIALEAYWEGASEPIKAVRRRLRTMESTPQQLKTLTLQEVELLLDDYQKILKFVI